VIGIIFFWTAQKNIVLRIGNSNSSSTTLPRVSEDNRAIMDSPTSSLDQNIDLSKLSEKDKQELQQFIVNESQKARIQAC
jgi:hypothetical protein